MRSLGFCIFAVILVFSTIHCAGAGNITDAGSDSSHGSDLVPVIIIMKNTTASLPYEEESRSPGQMSSAQMLQSSLSEAAGENNLVSELRANQAEDISDLWIANAIACNVSPSVADEIRKRPDVEAVVPDRMMRLLEYSTPGATNGTGELSGDMTISGGAVVWSVERIGAPAVWNYSINGSGINVSVVDTGIDISHPDLAGKVIAWKDFTGTYSTPDDDNGHGTHVAGTIAGTGVGGTQTGVAPGANLIGVKVFNSSGTAPVSRVILGFQWSVENHADIISFSGGSVSWDTPVAQRTEAITANATNVIPVNISPYENSMSFRPAWIAVKLTSADLSDLSIAIHRPDNTTVPAEQMTWLSPTSSQWFYKYTDDNSPLVAGNWSLSLTKGMSPEPSSYTIESITVFYADDGTSLESLLVDDISANGTLVVSAAGNQLRPFSDTDFGNRTIAAPGASRSGLTVGATKIDESIWEYSSRGPVDFGANSRIKPDVAAPGVGILSTDYHSAGYTLMSGTSMATPHVTGTAALMLQANRSLTPADLKRIIMQTSVDQGDEGIDPVYGAGRIDTRAAVFNVTGWDMMRGDFNNNGRTDIGDLTHVAYMAAGLAPSDGAADYNHNLVVDVGDAAKIAWYYVGKISAL